MLSVHLFDVILCFLGYALRGLYMTTSTRSVPSVCKLACAREPRLRERDLAVRAEGGETDCALGRERAALVVGGDVVVHRGHLPVVRVAVGVDVGEGVRVGAVAGVACRRELEEAAWRDMTW